MTLDSFFMIHDSEKRENEVDLCIPAEIVTYEHITFMRKNAGGLICLAVDKKISEEFGLPFLTELLSKKKNLPFCIYEKTRYKDNPAFSLSINHRNCYTGITDKERAFTIRKFYEMCKMKLYSKAKEEFCTPGHVILLRSRGIEHRKGHTELSIQICKDLGFFPLAVICEVLDDNGSRMSLKKAKNFAKKAGIDFYDWDS
ncbi:MAG: 3,4-dihydroxy-2-butanone-4-phosphate synthase [Candidatus Micrarchaeota archaeon]|nr:3,4-dihydroxy-2-butanone-4-phosphate synthase [Candidatus Micrarchaeota archaeon]